MATIKNCDISENDLKQIHIIAFISNKLINSGEKADLHKVFKIMYFADEKHLKIAGRTITGDRFKAMDNGPVPSNSYDILKGVRGDGQSYFSRFKDFFNIEDNQNIIPKIQADLDEFSDSDIEILQESINENQHLSYRELRKKSHDKAWSSAKNNSYDKMIHPVLMAKESGAKDEIIKYIKNYEEDKEFASFIASCGI